jgi:hypothetical protein
MRLSAWLTLLLGFAAASARADEAPSEAIARALDGLPGAWSAARLELKAGGASGRVRVGDPVAREIGVAQDAHAVVIQVDSHGVANVLVPSSLVRSGRLSPGKPLRLETLKAGPPAGRDRIWAVATRAPLNLSRLGLAEAQSQVSRLGREKALQMAEWLRDALAELAPGDVAVASASYRVVGRGDDVQYGRHGEPAHPDARHPSTQARPPGSSGNRVGRRRCSDSLRSRLVKALRASFASLRPCG